MKTLTLISLIVSGACVFLTSILLLPLYASCPSAIDLFHRSTCEKNLELQHTLLLRAQQEQCSGKKIRSAILNNLGNVNELQGNLAEAVNYYQQSISTDPSFATPWLGLGDVYSKMGKDALAQRCYGKGFVLQNYRSTEDIVALLSPKRAIAARKKPEITLYFGFNESALSEETVSQLKSFFLALNHPELVDFGFSLTGHTDSRGSTAFNQKLGLKRVRSIEHWLVDMGVAHHRLRLFSDGESRPVADNATPEGRQKNRRVEICLLGFTSASRAMAGSQMQQQLMRGEKALAKGDLGEAERVFIAILDANEGHGENSLLRRVHQDLAILYAREGKWEKSKLHARNF